MTQYSRQALASMALAAAGVVALYLLRVDNVAGLYVDDAWYILLGKALASGEGYRLISSATTPLLPVVPPGFPALLSIGFWISPSFPENLFLLKSISILAALGAGVVCWLDFTRHRNVPPAHATLLVAAATLTPAIVFLATSTVMAECVFTFGQLAAVVLVERIKRREPDYAAPAVIAGLATAAVILIRTAGAAVAVAAVAYLALGRRWRQLAIYAAVVAFAVTPWQLYSTAHAPTEAEREAHGGTIVYSYDRLLTTARLNDPNAGTLGVRDLMLRVKDNVFGIVVRDLGGIFVPSLYRGPAESGEETMSIGAPGQGSMGAAAGTMGVSLLFGVLIALGWIGTASERLAMPALLVATSIAIVTPVSVPTFRYIVPLTPYLLLFLWHGLGRRAVARVVLTCVVGFHLLDHTGYIQHKRAGTADWLVDARENDALLDWMVANVRGPGEVAASNPALVYLRTGRRTVASVRRTSNWERWRALGVRYVVSTLGDSLPPRELNARLLFRTDQRGFWVVAMDDVAMNDPVASELTRTASGR